MSSQVEQIKERLGVADVIGSYIKLEKAGANYKARCPFHNEKTPSFFVSAARGNFYCFGCGAKGDIFSFVEQFEGVDFMGALKVLAERAGIELKRENVQARTEREHMYACLESATIFYQKNLYTKSDNQAAVDYLISRGLTKETIKEWRIGFAENDWRRLFNYLKNERKFVPEEIERVGLIIKKDGSRNGGVHGANMTADDYYDRFRSRIMFPLFDSSGRVIGFSGRIFGVSKEEEKTNAKYVNSPETPLYHKSEVLYGFHTAKMAIRAQDFTILVEGQMDMIMSQQAGFKNTVAVSGTALTRTHLERLQRLSNRVVMAFDPDSAGIKAAERSAEIALSLGMEVRIAALPKGEDPALFILHHREQSSEEGAKNQSKNQSKEWGEVITGAKHIVEFILTHLLSRKSAEKPEDRLDDRALAKEIAAHILPLIARIPNAMEKSHFVSLIQHQTGLREDAIWEDLKHAEKAVANAVAERTTADARADGRYPQARSIGESQQGSGSSASGSSAQRNIVERKIAGIIFWLESLEKPALSVQTIKDRFDKTLLTTSPAGKTIAAVVARYEDEKDQLILEMEISYDKSEKLEAEIEELFARLERDYLKEELATIVSELQMMQRAGDREKVNSLLKKSNELSLRLAKLPTL